MAAHTVEASCRLGIYGGTFSPPHAGHVRAAKAFLEGARLDKLLIMPTYIPPHKPQGAISPLHRMAMVQRAFGELCPSECSEKRIEISDYEISQESVSYTANTLSHFAGDGRLLFFLCGTDMFLSMDSWYQPEVIFSLATVAYMRREQDSRFDERIAEARRRYEERYSARLMEIVQSPVEVSSTALREKLRKGKDTGDLLAHSVKAYIKEHQLYHE